MGQIVGEIINGTELKDNKLLGKVSGGMLSGTQLKYVSSGEYGNKR